VSEEQFGPVEIREILLRLSEEAPNLTLVGGQPSTFGRRGTIKITNHGTTCARL
jgi:hypothetical protein